MEQNKRTEMNVLCYVVMACFLSVISLSARELCRAQVDCPIDFDNDTVFVDYNAVMLSEVFEH